MTDHRNLVWMEASTVPKIVRIRLYLHRTCSKLGGGLRSWAVANDSDADHDEAVEEALRSVHNARSGHHGLRRTWLMLNEHYPGHAISQKAIREFIEVCPQCQKYRISMRLAISS